MSPFGPLSREPAGERTRATKTIVFLGAIGFLRPFLTTDFSTVTFPLRALPKVKLKTIKKAALKKLPEVSNLISDSSSTSDQLVPKVKASSEFADVSVSLDTLWDIETAVPKEAKKIRVCRSGNIPWGIDQEVAFRKLKQMAIEATELSIPDFGGANSGDNPFILLPDASAYGVGSGLFQFTKRSTEEEKAVMIKILETSLQEDTLVKFPKQAVLAPCGFHSVSLSQQQRGWTTWERELYAVLTALEFFADIISGTHVIIRPDHLNPVNGTSIGHCKC